MTRFLIFLFTLAFVGHANAQATIRGEANATLPTTNSSVKVATGLTYQTILTASRTRHSLTIQNNNVGGTDTCYILFGTGLAITSGSTTTSSNITVAGATVTAAQASIILAVGASYTRYFPDIPPEAIFGTCTTTADSIYVDVQ
jgi:hypothetical protein